MGVQLPPGQAPLEAELPEKKPRGGQPARRQVTPDGVWEHHNGCRLL